MVTTREQMDRDKRRKLGKVGSMRKQEKRQKEDDHKRGRKKLKYEVIGANWGEETLSIVEEKSINTTPAPTPRWEDHKLQPREQENTSHLVVPPLPQREQKRRRMRQGSIVSYLREEETPSTETAPDDTLGAGTVAREGVVEQETICSTNTAPPEEPELREGVVEQETVCSTHTAPPGEPELRIVDVPPNPTTEQECSFKRGKCQIHNVKGTKNVLKKQK